MKIYTINSGTLVKYFIIILAAAFFVFIAATQGIKAIGVFGTQRLLPIYCVETSEKKAAISFDCAWGADDIQQILEVLKSRNVEASFFIVGQWAEKFPEKVKLIASEGHDIANHSYSHLRMGELDKAKISNEIQLCGEKLSELSTSNIKLFRPPYGDYSNNVISAAEKLGYFTIQWNVDSLDWKPGISTEEIKNRVASKLKPGSIVLFHNDTPHTAAILPDIIDTIKNSGYSLVKVSQLIFTENYYIDFDGCQKKK